MINLTYWVLAILMFGLVIILHELGHFWSARLTGVNVMEFAVGFGPKLWSRKARSGITYSLRALPIGGYCRYVADDEDGVPDREDAYAKQKIWKRVAIALAGPFMNMLTAFLVLFVIYFALVGLPVPINTVGTVLPGLPAEMAGLQVGDKIVSVNGAPVQTTDEISRIIDAAKGEPLDFIVDREGIQTGLRVQPAWQEAEGRFMIGIIYQNAMVKYKPIKSLEVAYLMTADMASTIFDALKKLIFEREGADQLTGPIGTVTLIKEQTESGGLLTYLSLMAMISVNLGLFNLLPVPGLDGSKLIFLTIEKIRGKRMDPNKEGLVLLIGFGLMMVLMVVVMYQDIVRLLQ